MTYATTEDYKNWLQGRTGTVPLTEFNFWATRASEQIDSMTMNRLHNADTLAANKETVISVTCKLAELLYSIDTGSDTQITGFKIGGYSENYGNVQDAPPQVRIQTVVTSGLWLTGLLYRGVSLCE